MNKANLPKYKYGNKFSSKYGVKFTDPNYLKIKNKGYYGNTKSTLIIYYKKKYGDDIVLELIESFGLEIALEKLKNYGSPEPTETKIKQKEYYNKVKSNKVPLINYYKKKYGDAVVLELLENFSLEEALEKLRNYKNNISNYDVNPLQNLLIVC